MFLKKRAFALQKYMPILLCSLIIILFWTRFIYHFSILYPIWKLDIQQASRWLFGLSSRPSDVSTQKNEHWDSLALTISTSLSHLSNSNVLETQAFLIHRFLTDKPKDHFVKTPMKSTTTKTIFITPSPNQWTNTPNGYLYFLDSLFQSQNSKKVHI